MEARSKERIVISRDLAALDYLFRALAVPLR
jgi:hypothetical protein